MRLGNYKNIKIIFSSSRVIVAELEYQVKLNMKSSNEFLEWKNVRSFMDAYKSSIEFIKNQYLTNTECLSSTTIP